MGETAVTRRPQLRWRRQPDERGWPAFAGAGAGIGSGTAAKHVVTVAGTGGGRSDPTSFYWYGMGRNTLGEGLAFSTAEAAKTDAMAAGRKLWRAAAR